MACELLRGYFNNNRPKVEAFTQRLAAEIDNLNSLVDIPEEQITVLYDVASLIYGNIGNIIPERSSLRRKLTSRSMPRPFPQERSELFNYDFDQILLENEAAFTHCTDIFNFDLNEPYLDLVVQQSFPCLKLLSVLFRTTQPERCKTVCETKKNRSSIHAYTCILNCLSNRRFLNGDAHVAIGKAKQNLQFLFQKTFKDQQALNCLRDSLVSLNSQRRSADRDCLVSINKSLDRFGLSNIAFNASTSTLDALIGSVDKIISDVEKQIDDTQKLIKNFANLQKRFCVPVDTFRKFVVCGLSVLSGAVTKAVTNSNVCGTIVGLISGVRLAVAADLITFKPGLLSSNAIARKIGSKSHSPTILEYRQENRQKVIDAYLSYFGMPTQQNFTEM